MVASYDCVRMVFHPLLTNWVTILSRLYFSSLLTKMSWEAMLKGLLKSRCEICSSVHGSCYSVMEGSETGLTQLLLDKFMLTIVLFISEGAYKPLVLTFFQRVK